MKIWLSIVVPWAALAWAQIASAAAIDQTLDETESGSVIRGLPANLVTGILILNEPDGTVSDIVTFTNANRTAFLFSDMDENNERQFAELSQDRLSITIRGFPAEQRVTLDEAGVVNNGYTPAPGTPGYFQDDNGNTPRWIVRSDVEVPEPSALGLVGAGVLALAYARLRRRTNPRGRSGSSTVAI